MWDLMKRHETAAWLLLVTALVLAGFLGCYAGQRAQRTLDAGAAQQMP